MTLSFRELLEQARQTIREIDAAELDGLRRAGEHVIIDVREPTEHAQGLVPGARAIPRGVLEFEIEKQIPGRSMPISLYCAGGGRSLLAAESLSRMGYEDVTSLAGGFSLYKKSGFPVELRRQLNPEQSARYSRHVLLPEVGEQGQLKLLDARVLCVGAGGLGSPAALYLAAAGVGTIGFVDGDVVDRSNLQRQILHTEDRVGFPKVDSAELALRALNSDVRVLKHPYYLESSNALETLEGYDIILDGCDNFAARYLINDACVMLGKPCVHGAIYRFEGQATVFYPGRGPCYRCIYPEPPPPELAPSCQEAGVLGVLPGVVGVIQAIEVIKLILGVGESLAGRLMTFDALRLEFRELQVCRAPECPACGDSASITELIDYKEFCAG